MRYVSRCAMPGSDDGQVIVFDHDRNREHIVSLFAVFALCENLRQSGSVCRNFTSHTIKRCMTSSGRTSVGNLTKCHSIQGGD